MKSMAMILLLSWGSSWAAGMSLECRRQLEGGEVPIACFSQRFAIRNHERRQAFVSLLNRFCSAAIKSESRLRYLANLVQHPLLTEQCRAAAALQLEKTRYRDQDRYPTIVLKSLLEDGNGF